MLQTDPIATAIRRGDGLVLRNELDHHSQCTVQEVIELSQNRTSAFGGTKTVTVEPFFSECCILCPRGLFTCLGGDACGTYMQLAYQRTNPCR